MVYKAICNISISIHALREESDLQTGCNIEIFCLFQSTLSVRRATKSFKSYKPQPTISIHALREESDVKTSAIFNNSLDISIHALREESDREKMDLNLWIYPFQSTLSVRRATLLL